MESVTIEDEREALLDAWSGEITVERFFGQVSDQTFTEMMVDAEQYGAIDHETKTINVAVDDAARYFEQIEDRGQSSRLERVYEMTPVYHRGRDRFDRSDLLEDSDDLEELYEDLTDVPMMKARLGSLAGMVGGLAASFYGLFNGNEAMVTAGNTVFATGFVTSHLAHAYGHGIEEGVEETMRGPIADEYQEELGDYTISINNSNLGAFLEEQLGYDR